MGKIDVCFQLDIRYQINIKKFHHINVNKIELTPSANVSLVGLPRQSSESCKGLPAVVCEEFDASWVVESLFFASDEDEEDVFVGDTVAIL